MLIPIWTFTWRGFYEVGFGTFPDIIHSMKYTFWEPIYDHGSEENFQTQGSI